MKHWGFFILENKKLNGDPTLQSVISINSTTLNTNGLTHN